MPFIPALAGEDVFDIPESSPEKPRKPPVRASKVARKTQPQQTAKKGPLKGRGQSAKATVRQTAVQGRGIAARHRSSDIVDTVEATSSDPLRDEREDPSHEGQKRLEEHSSSQRSSRHNQTSQVTARRHLRNPGIDNQHILPEKSNAIHPASDGALQSGSKGPSNGAQNRRGESETLTALRSNRRTQQSKATVMKPAARSPDIEPPQGLPKQPNGKSAMNGGSLLSNGERPVNGNALQAEPEISPGKSRRRHGEALGSPEKRRKGTLKTTSPELPETLNSTRGSPRRSSRLAKKGSEKDSSQPPSTGIGSSPKAIPKSKFGRRAGRANPEAIDRIEEARSDNFKDRTRRVASPSLENSNEEDIVRHPAYKADELRKDDRIHEDDELREDDGTHEADGIHEDNESRNDDGTYEDDGTHKDDNSRKDDGIYQDDVINEYDHDLVRGDNTRQNNKTTPGDGAAPEGVTGDSDAGNEAYSLASVSESEQEEGPKFECLGQYRNWVLIKDAAANIGVVETDDGPRRKKVRACSRYGRDLLPVVRHLTGLYDKLVESSSDDRWQTLTQASEEIEVTYQELKDRIKSADAKRLKSDVADFTSEVYRIFIPCLVRLLESAMIALSPFYAYNEENAHNKTSLDSLKRVAHIQSLVLQLCDKAQSWRRLHVKKRKIKDVGRTMKEILPLLRDRLKPAFDREYTRRERTVVERESVVEADRAAAEQAARVQAELEGKRAKLAEIRNLQIRQLQDARKWNRSLVFGRR